MAREFVGTRQLQPNHLEQLLVLACLNGDERAWESMVRSHTRRIFNFCLRFTGRREEAEDLTQEVFIRIYRNLGSFRADSGSLQYWILSVARNLIIDHFRKERHSRALLGSRELEAMQLEDRSSLDPSRAFDQEEAFRLLSLALTALSPDLREAVRLRDLEGMSYRQVAETTGVSEGTVKSRLFHARANLAKILSSPSFVRRLPTADFSLTNLQLPPCSCS